MSTDMGERPSVTVVLRSHHDARLGLLRRALSSVWSQDIAEPIELLLVTSGYAAPLNSGACVPAAAGAASEPVPAGPRVFRHIRLDLAGDTRARLLNAGLQHANGEYLFFLDDDDLLCADALRRLLGKARETGADMVFGRVDMVIEARQGLAGQRLVVPYSWRRVRKLDLIRHNTAPLCSFLLKRWPAMELPLVDETLCSHEDYAMILKAMRRASITTLDDGCAVAEYWHDGRSATEKYAESLARDLALIRELKSEADFCVSGDEIVEPSPNPSQEQALKALIDAIPESGRKVIGGVVDHAISTKYGTTYVGWAASLNASKPELPHVFAITKDSAVLVEHRFPRGDVDAAKALSSREWGFSCVSRTVCDHFVAVASGVKLKIEIGEQARH